MIISLRAVTRLHALFDSISLYWLPLQTGRTALSGAVHSESMLTEAF